MIENESHNITSITFLYPSRRVGGAQMLFIRLADELSRYEDISVNVVDFEDGYLRSQLQSNSRINILNFKNASVRIGFKTILITPLSNLSDINNLVKGNKDHLNILFWCIQPYNLQFALYYNGRKFFGKKEQVKKIVEHLSNDGNIIYMDEANFLGVQEELKTALKPHYIPIPLDLKVETIERKKIENGMLNIGWLGRISYDKVNSIIKVIDEIKSSSSQEKIVFHIIGDGEKKADLLAYLKESQIPYFLTGTLLADELNKYIDEHIDLAVSMGTSCMEFAARKIPVFIIDYSFHPMPDKIKYNWLFETQNYTLGSNIESATNRNHSFEELLDQYTVDKNLGQKCYNYVSQNHDIKEVALKLIKHCRGLKQIDPYKFANIQRILNPLIYRFFYVLYRKIRDF
ncbi:hypothetical protein [Pedobacter nyackensis]|uniref:hypothetical protein n=1 Tax=Pedobacter nyackensis TaxID=475255 RepID=UPI00292D18D3|nr:hypothetical protein [Pedobacter nyackensis]